MSDHNQIPERSNIVDFICDIFYRRGREEYLGEAVTMEQHMLQAAYFAEQDKQPEVVVVAALLHDIGHFTSEFGAYSPDDTKDKYHEIAGAEILQEYFPGLISDCARYHVAAKRYLCATQPEYFDRLSDASIHTLELQGGPMTAAEVEEFERQPNLEKIIKVRHYDEAGKIADFKTPPLSHYEPMMRRQVATGTAV